MSEAASRLRELMSELEKDIFQPPLLQRKQFVQHRFMKPVSFSELLDQYITDVRRTKGHQTAQNYHSRLGHVERFACQPGNSKRWPTVNAIDREFIVHLKGQLQHTTTTPNGHAHSIAKPMSQRQIYNVMSSLGTMLRWALRPDVRRLPAHWVNPLIRELIGAKPTKDPLRKLALNDEQLLMLIQHCDAWQLTHLALSFVYPLRPEEAAGLLVEEVDFSARELRFGSRFGGDDYTKGKQSFVLPFPSELTPIFSHLVNGRPYSPLLCKRKLYQLPSVGLQPDTIKNAFRAIVSANSADVITYQDRKRYLRMTLSQFGGVSLNALAKEFKKLMRQSGITSKMTLYDLRSLNSTRLYQSGVNHLACRYFTGHAANDIMNSYVALQPHKDIQPYFLALQPVFQAISKRYQELSLGVTV
ncbi:MAG: tyrosine-type recombinase/integrase [Gemmatales bacterium]